MLSDRPSLRDDYPREKKSALTWLLAAILGAFVLELVLFSSWFKASNQIFEGLAVTTAGLAEGRIWTFVTHWLLHSPTNPLHVAFVLAGLFLLGRELEPFLGMRRFVAVFAGSVVLGALLWAAVNWPHGGSLIGGTAGVYGLFALYAAFYPTREISFLFFFLPVTVTPRYLAVSLLIVDLFGFAFYEVLGSKPPFAYAPSAHLGGMLAGWLYYRYVHQPDGNLFRTRSESKLPRWMKGSPKAATSVAPVRRTEPSSPASLRAEVDRILDKINSHGFAALSDDEKRVLDEAKDTLSRP